MGVKTKKKVFQTKEKEADLRAQDSAEELSDPGLSESPVKQGIKTRSRSKDRQKLLVEPTSECKADKMVRGQTKPTSPRPTRKADKLYPDLDKLKGDEAEGSDEEERGPGHEASPDGEQHTGYDDGSDFVDNRSPQKPGRSPRLKRAPIPRAGEAGTPKPRQRGKTEHASTPVQGDYATHDKYYKPDISDPYERQGNRSPDAKHVYPNHDNDNGENKSFNYKSLIFNLLYVVGITLIFWGIFLYITKPDSPVEANMPGETTVDHFKDLKPRLDDMKLKYSTQTKRFWRVISAALKRLLNDPRSRYPAVVILAVPRGHSGAGTCLAHDLASNVNKVFNFRDNSYINCTRLNHVSAARMKLDLDKHIIAVLSKGRGISLDHIEALPGETALLLHSYADGDNAPYKTAAIILVLHMQLANDYITERSVEDLLTEKWGTALGQDEMPALLSRIANNIAIMSPETGITC